MKKKNVQRKKRNALKKQNRNKRKLVQSMVVIRPLQYKSMMSYDNNDIKEILNVTLASINESKEKRIIELQGIEEPSEQYEFVVDEIRIYDTYKEISINYMVVALWSKMEKMLNKYLEKCTDGWTGSHKYNEIFERYQKIGIDLSALTEHSEIKTIRLISNSIKHRDLVSRELAEWNNGFTQEEEINISEEMINNYFVKSEVFMSAVIEALPESPPQSVDDLLRGLRAAFSQGHKAE